MVELEERVKNKFRASYEDLTTKSNFLPDNEMIYAKKCNNKFLEHKTKGNQFYKIKLLDAAIISYNEALKKAEYNSEYYGIALANRSAAFYERNMFKECLLDIEDCITTKHPEGLRHKLIERIKKCEQQLENNTSRVSYDKIDLLPNINKSCNIFGGSTAIELSYSEREGRHIVATQNLQPGEILFVEPAFVFAPIFTTIEQIRENKCYHCLKNIIRLIPCKSCSISIYCSSKCRDESWIENHCWECLGMKYGFWYKIGLGFPAFRALLKGIPSNFETLTDMTETHTIFGNDYKYFDSLESHLTDMTDETMTNICNISAQIVRYLELKTDFFKQLRQKGIAKDVGFIGRRIVKHMAQLSCNASVIEHWADYIKDSDDLTDKATPVASGVYPAVSLMNHSCQPNITVYFINKYIIVRCLERISKGAQIFNCYGIDYRYSEKQERQEHLKELYYFDCNCLICMEPTNEFKYFDSILCPHCDYAICLQIDDLEQLVICKNCESTIKNFAVLKDDLYVITDPELVMPTHAINLINHSHMFLTELNKGSFLTALDYLRFYIECFTKRIGEYHIDSGISLFFKIETMVDVLLRKKHHISSFDAYMKIHSTLEKYLHKLEIIFEINYPYEFGLLKELLIKFESF